MPVIKCPKCGATISSIRDRVCGQCGWDMPAWKLHEPPRGENLAGLGCAALIVGGLGFLVVRSCSPEPPAQNLVAAPTNESGKSTTVSSNVSARSDTENDLSISERGRVCRAAVADINGHPPAIVRIVTAGLDTVRVSYRRPSDGSRWTNECRFDGDRVIWRTVDAFGPGSGLGRWRIDPMDEVITYSIRGTRIGITTTYPGEAPSTNSYVVR